MGVEGPLSKFQTVVTVRSKITVGSVLKLKTQTGLARGNGFTGFGGRGKTTGKEFFYPATQEFKNTGLIPVPGYQKAPFAKATLQTGTKAIARVAAELPPYLNIAVRNQRKLADVFQIG